MRVSEAGLDATHRVSSSEGARGALSLIHCVNDIQELDVAVRASLRSLLDGAPTANPFQDPEFCGASLLGGGQRCFHIAIASKADDCDFYAFCTENFAASRYLPFVRTLIVNKGPIAKTPGAFEAGLDSLRTWSRTRRYVSLTASPLYNSNEADWLNRYAVRNRWSRLQTGFQGTLRLDLAPSIEVLFADLKKATRYEIRRAERAGVRVFRAESEQDFEKFFEVWSSRGESKGFGVLRRGIFDNLSRKLLQHRDRGALFLTELSGAVVGGVVALRAGSRVHYVYGAVDGKASTSLPAGYPALWQAILWAKNIGAHEFDFGGYSLSGNPAVRRFKRGFGGIEVQFQPALHCRFNPLVRWPPWR